MFDCGFIARCALEVDDSSQARLDKIFAIIDQCKFAIHDLSRTEPDSINHLPRFNMPLELGIFLGAKRYGSGHNAEKNFCQALQLRLHEMTFKDKAAFASKWLREYAEQ